MISTLWEYNFIKIWPLKRKEIIFYKLEKEIIENGPDFYYSIVKGKDYDNLKYIISKRIHGVRHGLFPTINK